MQLVPASKNEARIIFEQIQKRIDWMNEKGIKGWNTNYYLEAYPLSYFEEEAERGELYVLKDSRLFVLGGVILLEQDDNWTDDKPSYYIHSLVGNLDYPEAGKIILKKCEELAINRQKLCLRLDCAKENIELNHYYEELGFREVGECQDGPYYQGITREKRL